MEMQQWLVDGDGLKKVQRYDNDVTNKKLKLHYATRSRSWRSSKHFTERICERVEQ